jgi:hypothetical protein
MLCVVYAEWHILTLFAECHYAEWHYAECRYADCRGAFFFCLRGFLSGFVCNKNEKNDEKKNLNLRKTKTLGKVFYLHSAHSLRSHFFTKKSVYLR